MSLATDLQFMIDDSFFGGAESVSFTRPDGTNAEAVNCLVGDASDADSVPIAGLEPTLGISIYGDRSRFTTLPQPGWLATVDSIIYRVITVKKTPEGSGIIFECEEKTA